MQLHTWVREYFYRQLCNWKCRTEQKHLQSTVPRASIINRMFYPQQQQQPVSINLEYAEQLTPELRHSVLVQTKILVVDLVAAGNTSCEGPEWAALKAMASELDIGALRFAACLVQCHSANERVTRHGCWGHPPLDRGLGAMPHKTASPHIRSIMLYCIFLFSSEAAVLTELQVTRRTGNRQGRRIYVYMFLHL